ncbi:N-acyl amino acid synthase FeeM domain-containing protein [Tardiphaga sp. 1201_B9_N1_1]|uniref:N-acyl amino acid synthase FeeM domain-containing protein n=1 Tax=unclassified Tardiphaga TaxID=2631404 RepID=UPI003F1F2C83
MIETDAQREEIYRLRYRAYLHEGAIEPRREQQLYDRFDDMPNSWTFGIYVADQLAASIRVSVATNAYPDTPSTEVFGDVLLPELLRGKVIVDPSRFVADPSLRSKTPELPYLVIRLGYIACDYFNADMQLATVRSEHRAFYRKVFFQQPLTEPRPIPSLTKPLSLMGVDYPSVRSRVLARYPFFRSFIDEQIVLFERPISRDLFSETRRPIRYENRANTLATMLQWGLSSEVALDLGSSRYDKKERQLVALMIAKTILRHQHLDVAINTFEEFFQESVNSEKHEEYIWLVMVELAKVLEANRKGNSAQSFFLAAADSAMRAGEFFAAKQILGRVSEMQ